MIEIKEMTLKEAAEMWVGEMNAIPLPVVEKLYSADCDSIREITPPSMNDEVYIFNENIYGEIVGSTKNEDGEIVYVVKTDEDKTIELTEGYFEVERDSLFPCWGTLWTFGSFCDDHWLDDAGVQLMADCGFRIYESDDFGGYIFGIDGAGYDFYDAHWIPLYKARGLRWHKESN